MSPPYFVPYSFSVQYPLNHARWKNNQLVIMPNDVDSSPLTELDSEEELEDDEGHAEEMKNEKNEKQDTLLPLPLPLPLPLYRADSDSTILRPPSPTTLPRRKVQSGMCFSFRAISEDLTHCCWR